MCVLDVLFGALSLSHYETEENKKLNYLEIIRNVFRFPSVAQLERWFSVNLEKKNKTSKSIRYSWCFNRMIILRECKVRAVTINRHCCKTETFYPRLFGVASIPTLTMWNDFSPKSSQAIIYAFIVYLFTIISLQKCLKGM